MKLPRIAALVLAGAAAAAGSTTLTWATADWTDELRGPLHASATGAAAAPAVLALAGAAVAALGAVLASRGLLRRLIAVSLALIGLLIGWLAVSGLISAPRDALIPAGRAGTGTAVTAVSPVGPTLAVLGAVLILAAGCLLAAQKAAPAAMGSRYERRSSPAPVTDPDLDMWKALDADQDPTDGDPGPGASSWASADPSTGVVPGVENRRGEDG